MEMTDAEVREAVQGHVERNEELVRQIVALGINLSDVRPVDLHFLAPSKRAADALMANLRTLGYEHLILGKGSLFNRTRSVTISALLSVNDVTNPGRIEALVRAAGEAGAIHDGWGMPVTPGG
jgi:hypothetical protein